MMMMVVVLMAIMIMEIMIMALIKNFKIVLGACLVLDPSAVDDPD